MIPRHHRRAFTLVEILVATAVFSMVGLITYGVASEGLYAFSRNISINRSYSDARRALDRIGGYLQTAGYTPQLLDATGAATTVSPAAGIRFWRFSDTPIYNITTPALNASTLVLDLHSPSNNSVLIPPPAVGDLITVPALSFQATAVSVTSTSTSAIVGFTGTVASLGKITSVPPTATITTTNGSVVTTSQVTIQYTCTDWHPVAFIAVGTQLRYYPTFVAGTTAVNTASNYRVMTNLVSSVGGQPPPLPFSYGPSPSVNVDIYAEAPDYNNRNLGTANTYTFLSTAFSPRNPALLTSPP